MPTPGTDQLNRAAAAAADAEPEAPEGATMASITVREALRDAMAEEMRRDERVFVMGEEVAEYQGAYKVTQGLLEEFGPKRVVDTPITEYGFAGVGTGAAMGGLRPIVEFMTFNFAMQAIDHIINSAAKTNYMSGGQMRCPVVFRGPNGAASRVAAQHSQNYGPGTPAFPGLMVIAPYQRRRRQGAAEGSDPHRGPGRVPRKRAALRPELRCARGRRLRASDRQGAVVRPGKDVTIVSYSIGVGVALEAAEQLMGEGIDAEVIDLRTLRPLDKRRPCSRALRRPTGWWWSRRAGRPARSAPRSSPSAMTEGFDDLDAPVLGSPTPTFRCPMPPTSRKWR
jgi:pyruvate dehydrogenase E1 component beta subunit